MTSYRRGDVVLVPFDFTDRSGTKWRPAVVVSSGRYNQGTPDLLIASVTGNLGAIPHPGDHRVQNWEAARLVVPSLIQTKLATIEGTVVGRKLGTLSDLDMRAFDRGLREALQLA